MKHCPIRYRIWGAAGLLALMAYLYLAYLANSSGPFPIDRAVRGFFQGHQDTSVGWIIGGWAIFGDWQILTVLLVVLAFFFFRDMRKEFFLFFLFALGGGGALGLLSKVVVGRLRPGDPRFGFPSGHTLAALVVVSGLLYFAYRTGRLRRPLSRLWSVCVGGLIVLGVGVSRIFTDSHWLTDVFGAILLGVAVTSGVVLAMEPRVAGKKQCPDLPLSRQESFISPQP